MGSEFLLGRVRIKYDCWKVPEERRYTSVGYTNRVLGNTVVVAASGLVVQERQRHTPRERTGFLVSIWGDQPQRWPS